MYKENNIGPKFDPLGPEFPQEEINLKAVWDISTPQFI